MQLHSKTFGSGEPLIILHGLLGMSDNWQTFARKMAEDVMVITPDMRNHGRSPHASGMSYRLMVDDLVKFMESQWIYDGAIILGHSMGGKIAMQLALTRPDLVKKLIIVDIAPIDYKPAHHTILNALKSINLPKKDRRSQVTKELLDVLGDQTVATFLMKNLGRTADGALKWKINLDAIMEGYPSLLEAPEIIDDPFDNPTLFIKGGNSDYVSLKDHDAIRQFFPNSQVEEIPNAGHWVHADQPKRFYQMVTQWLSKD